ncbi:MAG: hypothetical protein AAFX04_12020 [Pseudomonadota bacterium]
MKISAKIKIVTAAMLMSGLSLQAPAKAQTGDDLLCIQSVADIICHGLINQAFEQCMRVEVPNFCGFQWPGFVEMDKIEIPGRRESASA